MLQIAVKGKEKLFKQDVSFSKQKRPDVCLTFSAPQVGLEPTTYGLTVRRSNQLSYWGISPFFCTLFFKRAMQI